MYLNFEGELRKRQITRQKIADDFKINVSTVSQKLTKKDRLKLDEAYKLRDLYCPGMEIDFLFEWSDSQTA